MRNETTRRLRHLKNVVNGSGGIGAMELMRRQVTAAILAAMVFAVPGMTHDSSDRESGYRYGYEAGYRDGFDHAREDYHRGVGDGLESREHGEADDGWYKWIGRSGEGQKGYVEGQQR